MYKKNVVILGSLDDHLFKLSNEYNLILINDDIHCLEKNKYIMHFPIKNTLDEIKILTNILKKRFKIIDAIIINIKEPYETKPIEKIKYDIFCMSIRSNINNFILTIKYFIPLLKLSENPNIIIIFHKNLFNIKAYWSITESTNKFLLMFTQCMNEEYKNISDIKINFISTENIINIYKKNIFPYINLKKTTTSLYKICFYIIKNTIKNLIIKI